MILIFLNIGVSLEKSLFPKNKTRTQKKKLYEKSIKRQRTKCMKKVFPFFIVLFPSFLPFSSRLFYLKNDNIVFNRTFCDQKTETNAGKKYQPSNIFEKFILIGVREFFIRLLRRHKRHAIDIFLLGRKVFSFKSFFGFLLNTNVEVWTELKLT